MRVIVFGREGSGNSDRLIKGDSMLLFKAKILPNGAQHHELTPSKSFSCFYCEGGARVIPPF
jgi:hypothetical protein